MINSEDERLLLNKIKANPDEFGLLFDMYYSRIFGYILRRTLNYDLASDITAETFLKAFLGIKNFKWKEISVSSWLFKIATNEVNSFYRRRKYSPQSLDKLIDEDLFDVAGNENYEDERKRIEEEIENHNEFIEIQKKLEKLPVKYQEVIAFRFFEEMSIKEISVILNKKEGTIKSLISRGLNKLRDSF